MRVARYLPPLVAAAFSLLPATAPAEIPALPDGIAVVADPVTLTREVDVTPGVPFDVYVVMTDISLDGMSAVQFALELDPGIVLTNAEFASEVTINLQPAPGEYRVGFGVCLRDADAPFEIARLTLLALENVDGATVGVGPLPTSNLPLAISTCAPVQRPALNLGGVVLNAVGPTIAFFEASPAVAVEGRTYEIAWSVVGAQTVELDGVPVAAADEVRRVADVDRTFELTATAGAEVSTATTDVEVIREPRVERFDAIVLEDSDPPVVQVRWDVTGANQVEIVGFGSQGSSGAFTVPLSQAVTFELNASNEWGTTTAVATIGDVSDLPPYVTTFSAVPASFVQGSTVTLSWTAFNADTARIDPDVGPVDPVGGSTEVFPTGDTTYVLTLTNSNGTNTGEVSVVEIVPEIELFRASPTSIFPGESTQLSWRVSGGLDVRIEPEPGFIGQQPVGAVNVVPTADDVVYTLTASAGSIELTATTDPIAWLPPVVDLRSPFPEVLPFEGFTLRIDCEGCDTLDLQPVPGPITPVLDTNFVPSAIGEPTWFVAAATNAAGTSADSVEVGIIPREPTASLDVTPLDPFAGGEVELTAQVRYAANARIEPGIGPVGNGTTTFTTTVSDTTQFRLIAENAFGTSESTALVQPRRPEVSLTGVQRVFPGTQAGLIVSVAGADSVVLEPFFGQIAGSGNYSVVIDEETTFTLTAFNAAGSSSDTWTVEMLPPIIESFVVAPLEAFEAQDVNLSWRVRGATDLRIVDVTPDLPTEEGVDLFGPLPAEGTRSFFGDRDRDLRLVATNSAGLRFVGRSFSLTRVRIVEFAAQPPAVFSGGEVTVNWEVVTSVDPALVDVSFVWVGNTVFENQPLVGEFTTTLEEEGRFQLRVGVEVDGDRDDAFASLTVPISTEGLPILQWAWQADGERVPPLISPFVPFDGYVVGQYPIGGLLAFELRAIVPPELIIVRAEPAGDRAVPIFRHPDWEVGTGECLYPTEPIPLLEYEFIVLDAFSWEGTVLDVDGIPDPSLASGEPAYANCALDIFPWQRGDPMLVQSSGVVSATVVELRAEQRNGGVALQWSAPGIGCAERAHVFRMVEGADALHLGALTGPDACAEWFDADAPFDLETVRYGVTLETPQGALTSPQVAVELAPDAPSTPGRSRLLANVPNPFNPATELRFELAKDGPVRLEIFDTAGRLVRRLEMPAQTAGPGRITWRGLDGAGRTVGSGVYLVRLVTDDVVDTRRIVLLK